MALLKKASQLKKSIFDIRQGKGYKAETLGLKNLSEKLGIVKGFPTYIGATPRSGKTEVLLEILLQLTEIHGWKHLLLTGETGKAEEIYAKLIHKVGKKPFMTIDRHGNKILDSQSEQEADRNYQYINEHFTVIDALEINTKKSFRWDDLTKILNEESHLTSELFDTLSIDPFYEIDREDIPQTDGQLRALFSKVYQYCQKENKVVFLTSHIVQMKRDVKLLDGSYDRSEPTAFDFSGGQAWYQKGYNLVTLYKPDILLDLPDGAPEWNEVWLNVRKSKPDGTGNVGRIKLYFDYYQSNRYYEMVHGEKKFSRDWKAEESEQVYAAAEAMQPSTDWNEPKENDLAPF